MRVLDKERWRFIDLEYDNPCMNLAVEEAIPTILGRGFVQSTVRFWRNVNMVVLGRFQDIVNEVNLNACKRYKTRVIRRFTGGGAVYQDLGNLNYAISLRRDHPLVSNDISTTVETLSQGVIEGLNILGIKVEYKPSKGIFICGKKISGSASAVKQGFFFNHGTLLISSNLDILSEVLSATSKRRKSDDMLTMVTNLEDELGKEISVMDVKKALKKGFEKTFQIRLIKGKLCKEEVILAHRLLKEKYVVERL